MARDFRMYYGAASGQQRKTLKRMEEPNVMISYATLKNTPWDGIENLFIDSGGYSYMVGGGSHDPTPEYLDFIETHDPGLFALQDFPCEPEVLSERDATVGDHQQLTTENAIEALNRLPGRDVTGEPVAVVQGWDVGDYLSHIDDLRDHGCLTRTLGIGSVCRRGATDDLREIILAVRDELPDRYRLHGFGIKGSVLEYPEIREALWSADSLAYDYGIYFEDRPEGVPYWFPTAQGYLKMKMRIEGLGAEGDRTTLAEFV